MGTIYRHWRRSRGQAISCGNSSSEWLYMENKFPRNLQGPCCKGNISECSRCRFLRQITDHRSHSPRRHTSTQTPKPVITSLECLKLLLNHSISKQNSLRVSWQYRLQLDKAIVSIILPVLGFGTAQIFCSLNFFFPYTSKLFLQRFKSTFDATCGLFYFFTEI